MVRGSKGRISDTIYEGSGNAHTKAPILLSSGFPSAADKAYLNERTNKRREIRERVPIFFNLAQSSPRNLSPSFLNVHLLICRNGLSFRAYKRQYSIKGLTSILSKSVKVALFLGDGVGTAADPESFVVGVLLASSVCELALVEKRISMFLALASSAF